jgi:hypothetical protein
MPAHDQGLDGSDANELGDLLSFLGDWFGGSETTLLAASLQRFVGMEDHDFLTELRTDLARFRFLLGTDDGTQLFARERH